jgi:hypothetical protein
MSSIGGGGTFCTTLTAIAVLVLVFGFKLPLAE